MSAVSLLVFWLSTVLSLDQWSLVHRDGSFEAMWGPVQITAAQRSELATAWVWSGVRAPRRVAPPRIGLDRFSNDESRLALRVVRRAGGKPPADLRLLAAPAEMWAEVPEAALPSWPIPKSGQLAIPIDSGRPWRLRVAGQGEGSWWVNVRPGQRTAVLTSSPAAGIEVEVLGPEGKPVLGLNGSLQEAFGRGGPPGGWALQHGEVGKLTVPGLPDAGDLSLTVMKVGAAPLVLRGRPSSLPHQVRLAAGAELRGRIVDPKGAPVGGVSIEGESFSASDLPQVMRVKAKSEPDGAWRLPGLPAGKVAWSVRAPGFVPLTETVDVEAGERKDLGTRKLEPGTTLALQVIDDVGAPIPGARVLILAGRFMATADGIGIARLEGLPAAPVEVNGQASGHQAGKVRFNLPYPPNPQLVLPRAFVVTGRLIDASGVPILRGFARVHSKSCEDQTPLHEGGRFQLDIPPLSDEAEIVLRSPAAQEARLHLLPGERGEVRDLGDLIAPRGLVITGRIVRADDGSPIAGARAWTTRQGPEGPAVAWVAGDILEAVAGEDGRFELSGLLPAPATLRIDAAGLARKQLTLMLTTNAGQGGVVDLGTLALHTGATLRVRVDSRVGDSPNAIARADVGNRWLEPDMLTAQVWNGEAVLPNVPAGDVRVSVVANRQVLCQQAVVVPEDGEQAIDCHRSGLVVTGLVQVGGAPASDGYVSWSAPDPDLMSRIDTVVSPARLRQTQVVGAGRPGVAVPIGADGRFETDRLTPGRWHVTWLSLGSASAELIVDIPPNDRFDTVLKFPGQAVSGTVTDRHGNPVEEARVRDLISGTLAFTRADGSFSLIGLKAGKAVLQAQLQEQKSPLSELEVKADQPPVPVHLVLGDNKSPVIAVHVTDPEGAPIPGAFVFLEEEGNGQRLILAGADGQATVTLDPPLPLRVRAAAFAGGAWGFGRWLDWSAATQGITVSVSGNAALEVKSQKLAGSPRIVSADGWDVSWLLRLLGAPPTLSPEQPLQITGLTAGQYRVSLDEASITLTVSRDRAAQGKLEQR